MFRDAALELAEIAARPGTAHERAQALLDELQLRLPFDGAWMALAEPDGSGYTPLASTDLDGSSLRYLSGPRMAHDIDRTGANRDRPPISLSDLPYAAQDLQTWAECLLPAGFHEALSVALFEDGGRHVGFMTVLFRHADPPSSSLRRELTRLVPQLATGIDPVRSLAASTVIVRDAEAGVVILPGDAVAPLPGLPDHSLLAPGSLLVSTARDVISEGRTYATFLWRCGTRRALDDLVRVTVLAGESDLEAVACGALILSSPRDLRGLTTREFEVLGHVIEGCSNLEIARALVVSPRTIAAHLEHILAKLDASSRACAAVRAERAGLYVPAVGTRAVPVAPGTPLRRTHSTKDLACRISP
ncbi:LuxR C-terminal-related transcriptional regulator [Microbacterium sp. lyk4-40-TSB-66]|uniref:helix-turn-helix transcriptional regulator n=1 Tax=Microbacterium sp. lyk4-40-TSB-66 TaxID=3040294 RepID=UPI00254FECA7|nr:LuxR C-terminal-related transcriptional regulator [Microbacterium sp. lyk4-40-TSB-66]